MANTRETVTQTYEGESIQCAKIVVNDTADLKLPGICPINDSYIFQLVAKADAERTIMVTVGDQQTTITLSTSFDRYVETFPSVNVAFSNDVYISFPSGTYYLYNLQLERAINASGWRPAPEDSEDYTDAAEASAKSYASSQVSALDASLNQQDVFNRLTNNGQTQGIYLQNGKVYINASFIQSGTISANYISGGTIDADDVSIINLIADHVLEYGNNNTWMLESKASYMDLRQLVSSIWKQRIGIYISTGGGVLRVSSGDVDANGNPLGGTSRRTFVYNDSVVVGKDENGDNQGTVYTKFVSASSTIQAGAFTTSGSISATGNISSSGNISATSGNGNFKYINADTIGSEKASNTLSTVNGTWTFSINGCRFICIEGQAGSLEIQTTVIPCATIANYTYGWRLSTGTTSFTVSKSGSTCTVTLTAASNSTCRLLRCYSIV